METVFYFLSCSVGTQARQGGKSQYGELFVVKQWTVQNYSDWYKTDKSDM